MRVIRASEIGVYLYCHRAWWYQLQGIASENQQELASGSGFHRSHGRRVLSATLLRAAGWILLLAALVVAAVTATLQLLP